MPDARLQKCRALYDVPVKSDTEPRLSGKYRFYLTTCRVCGSLLRSEGYGNVMIRQQHSCCTPSLEEQERMAWCVPCREVTPHDGLGCRVCRRMASPLEPDADTPWGV